MAEARYNYEVDPFASDTPAYIHIQSAYYSGAFANVTVSAAANYPTVSPTRYFINFPFIIDVSDLAGARPIAMRNVTSSVNMTRVSGAPAANEYRVAPSTSNKRTTIEVNSAQASQEIGFDFYILGSCLTGDEWENMRVDSIETPLINATSTGIITFESCKVATGGETAPDCDNGGITLQQGNNNAYLFTLKSTNVAHGMTSVLEADSYAGFSKENNTNGGLKIFGLSAADKGLGMFGYATTADTTTSTAAHAPFTIDSRKKSGTTVGALANNENIGIIANDDNAIIIFKGNGDIYSDSGNQSQTVSSTPSSHDQHLFEYDDENDIELSRALQKQIANKWDDEVFKKNKDRLTELGIMENGFISDRKTKALLLGTTQQLFNIIKNIAKKMNITEEQLFEFAKDYT